MTTLRIAALAACSLAPVFAAYQYDYANLLNPYTASQWTGNGTYTASNNLFSSYIDPSQYYTATSGGSLIFNSTVPGPYNTYEVRATLAHPSTGEHYFIFLRATPNSKITYSFNWGEQATGTFYALHIYIGAGGCGAGANLEQSISGTLSALYVAGMSCHDGMVVRACMLNGFIAIYVDNVLWTTYGGLSIASGQPGIGVANVSTYTPDHGISKVDIGHYDTVVPLAINPQMIGTSVFGNRVDMQWQGGQDDANGIGIGFGLVKQSV